MFGFILTLNQATVPDNNKTSFLRCLLYTRGEERDRYSAAGYKQTGVGAEGEQVSDEKGDYLQTVLDVNCGVLALLGCQLL